MRLSSAACKAFARRLLERVWLLYGLLALTVLVPLLRPGYILTLDMVFTPRLRMPTSSSNDYMLRVLLHALNFVLSGDVIEKIILFTVLLLSGVGMHRLVQSINGARLSLPYTVGAYVGGILYTVNPFTYDRFMAGQYEVLLGYALLPWFVRLLLQFLANPDMNRMLWLAACALAVSIVSIHDIGLMAILAAMACSGLAWQRRADAQWRSKVCRLSLLACGMWLVASSYWLIPLILGRGSVAAQISSIGTGDQSAFATVGGSALGRIGNIVRLQGFWVEPRGMYELPQARVHAWGLIGLLIWTLVIAGTISLWHTRQRMTVLIVAASAGLAGLLAIGILNGWPAKHVPLLTGYREPEKFVALIALAYAAFAARGAAAVIVYCRTRGAKTFAAVAAIAVLLLPIAWTPAMLHGFAGQLKPVQYPAGWTAVNTRLNADTGNFQTLFLPWHLYMRFNFEGRIIANPAPAFFDKPVIVSDNPEFKGAALSKPTATKRRLDRLLSGRVYSNSFGAQLAALHIKYIIVDHDDDPQDRARLANVAGMQLVSKGATLDLYRNTDYRE